jgi:hypothetical protein
MRILAVMAISLLPGVRVMAEEITFASHAEIMSVLERQNTRIAELEAALANGGGCSSCSSGCCDSCADSCCDSCCDGCCDPCCRPGGIIGSVEVTFLKPHFSAGSGAGDDFDWNYEVAPRVTVGYQGTDGLGYRLRWWEFDHTQRDPGGAVNDEQSIDTYIIDLEFVDSMSLGCYWDASNFGGFRYLEFGHERVILNAAGAPVLGQAFGNSSIGLTVGGELRRCIGNGLAGYVNTRASLLMGDEKEFNNFGAGFVLTDTELDNIYYMWEAQAGAQWTRELEMGGYLFARAGVEVQIWDNAAGSGPGFGLNSAGTEDFGLGGATLSAGIIR